MFIPSPYNNAAGAFNGFVEDQVRTSNWIISGNSAFTKIRIALNDVNTFVVGNIVRVSGSVYNGNFEVDEVIPPSSSSPIGSIVLKTPFLKKSPTVQKTNTYDGKSVPFGYIDTAPHSVKNLTMYNPLVFQWAKTISNTKGKKEGGKDQKVFDDVKWWQWLSGVTVIWDKVVDGTGVLQYAYKSLKKGEGKGGYSVAEYKYIKAAADKAIGTIKNNQTRRRANDFMNKKFVKLQNQNILMPTTSTNEYGQTVTPEPTGNQSEVARQSGGSYSSISTSSIGKYLLLGGAAIGAIVLLRGFLKK